jgi:phosphoglucosamine mutase
VVISASHNPYEDNGIKIFSPSGKKLSDEAERAIEAEVAGPRYSFPDFHITVSRLIRHSRAL